MSLLNYTVGCPDCGSSILCTSNLIMDSKDATVELDVLEYTIPSEIHCDHCDKDFNIYLTLEIEDI